MNRTDTLTKGFLSYGQPRSQSVGDKMLTYQDPTYLGFQWRIIDTRDYSRASGELDLDYYPQGLFLPNEDPDSAYSYFLRTGQTARAEMISQFRRDFLALLKNAPWYFTKVSGIADIWKIDPANSFRGKDKAITIETEEAIDLKITYLMDLYRKACFDANWMRYALPENQRSFAMELVVAEIRPLQISLASWEASQVNPYTGAVLNDVGGLFTSIQQKIRAKANELSNNGVFDPVTSFGTNVQEAARAFATNAGSGLLSAVPIKAPWSTTTFLSFRFDFCTFDPFDNAPAYLENVGKTPGEMAKNTIVINTPYISEVNSYGLLGALLKDSLYQADYSYNLSNFSRIATTLFETLGSGSNATAAQAILRNIANRVGLGNAYGISPTTLVNTLGNFANNPLGTLGNLINEFTGPNQQAQPVDIGNIGFTGEEAQLVREFIGVATQSQSGAGVEPLVQNAIGTAVENRTLLNPNLVTQQRRNIYDTGDLTAADFVRARIGNSFSQ